MISKIDIRKFGLFNDFAWDLTLGKTETFRRLNIIYGRNYSGKTTLSRILKCFEDNALHKNFLNSDFTITLTDGKKIKSSSLSDVNGRYQMRVYNTDFVNENLNWLHNEDGTIKPFTILGASNVELDKKIQELEEKLGSVADRRGLLFDYYTGNNKLSENRKRKNSRSDQLDEKLRKHANDKIKLNPNLFFSTTSKKTYAINDIKDEIEIIKKNIVKYILNDEGQIENVSLLKESPFEDIQLLSISKPKFADHYRETRTILETEVKPTQPIIDLINDSLLQEWVRQGINYHKGKRETCGFCGNVIGRDLWSKLDAHFSEESDRIRLAIAGHIQKLETAKKSLNDYLKITKNSFYKIHQLEFERIKQDWDQVIKVYSDGIDQMIGNLKRRELDIFRSTILPEIEDKSDIIFSLIQSFNALIIKQNEKTKSLSIDQSSARKALRYSDIAHFLQDIDYQKECELIKKAQVDLVVEEAGLKPLQEIITTTLQIKRNLEGQAKDESRGAELVNRHLGHFFGNHELKLAAEGDTGNSKFTIMRNDYAATNLSEGECSLISFCYFVAKIEDELNNPINCQKLIIYVDDPISSLDNNHVFFMFSLIESIIAKPKNYCQLFISTHNLDFLKYLKRLTYPTYKPTPETKEKKPDLNYFMIERLSGTQSSIKLAPFYLKYYITEFNYLFDQIYQCSQLSLNEITINHQYNFGNNMRKFLEAYLFYKYPSHKMTTDEKMNKYFKNDAITINLINRVINEYSHIGEHFERGMIPVDVAEIKNVSLAVLQKLNEYDPDQYAALVQSVA